MNTRDDEEKALRQYRDLAEEGDANSQFRLGEAYSEGEGVRQSDTEAVKWWSMAAEQGHAAAQHSLGMAYCEGQGISQDDVRAHMWFSLAADCELVAGHDRVFFTPSSEEMIESVEEGMTGEQRAQARSVACEWKAAKGRV